jgi:hypothetical protein
MLLRFRVYLKLCLMGHKNTAFNTKKICLEKKKKYSFGKKIKRVFNGLKNLKMTKNALLIKV